MVQWRRLSSRPARKPPGRRICRRRPASTEGVFMAYDFIQYEPSDGIGRITLDRPEKLNALSQQLQDELIECALRADDDPDIRVLTLRANGRAFSAGYDITPGVPSTPEDAERARERRENIRWDMHRMKQTPARWATLLNLSKPIIAGVHGYCLAGGTDLAMHCDIVIAADDAQIGFPPVRSMGGPPTHMWTYMVGPQWAKWFLLTGESVSGAKAAELGFALKSVPRDELDAEVEALAGTMAKIPWELLAANKSIVNRAMELMGRNTLQFLAAETDAVAHQAPIVKEFTRRSHTEGLKSALDWRDRPFRDYRGREG